VHTDGATRLLWHTAAEVRSRLILLVTLMASRVALVLAVPALLAAALAAVLGTRDTTWPVTWLGLTLIAIAAAELTLGQLAATTAGRSAVGLQTRTVAHLLTLDSRRQLPAGDAVARVLQAAPSTANLPLTIAGLTVSTLGSAAALVALFWIDWRAGLVFTLAVPVVLAIARRFMSQTTDAQHGYYQTQAEISHGLLAALTGARTIRASGTVATEISRVLRPLPKLSAAGRTVWQLQRGAVWQLQLLLPLTQVLVLAVSGLGVAAGRIAPAQLLAITGYLAIASGAFDHIDTLFEIAHARAGAGRLADALAQPAPADGTRPLPAGPGAVSLRGVAVHRDGQALLQDLDLDIPADTCLALVGRSGAGKSLTAALIGRLLDPDSGQVTLDGVAVHEIRLDQLRRAVVYAFAQPVLIGTTIHDTIAYGRPDLSAADVASAAQAARADTFIGRLPGGYAAELHAAPMSGGERQRLGLARAFARPARVYILDDATSGLDTVTEAEVSQAITSRLAGRTRVIVAHRAATAARCDLVAWLDAGRIRAVAAHADLWHDPDYRAVFADSPQQPTEATAQPETSHA
jgi:ATP-binding cassette subfamily B protein